MGEFSADWLSLREPVDHAARSEALTTWVLDALPRNYPIRILDLGCGTGSNLRYLTKQGPYPFFSRAAGKRGTAPSSQWLLVDEDAALLARVPAGEAVITMRRNLAALTPDLFEGQTLITASALLDLVSADWLRTLTQQCRAVGAAALFALSYDGRIECEPAEPEDGLVRELVNEHQHTDKGVGPALGPDATAFAATCFAAAGYEVRHAASDWVLTPDPVTAAHVGPSLSSGATLQRELITGWADAATVIAPQHAVAIADWRRRRLKHVVEGCSRIIVGHQDVAAKLENW
jgi:SAM-dependent methyltransferase